MTDSTLRCAAGAACVDAENADGQRVGAVTANPGVCQHCLNKMTRCCGQLVRDWELLHTFMGERRAAAGEYIRSTPTPGLPIDPNSEALAAAIVELMDIAADMVATRLNASQPTGRRNTAPDIEIRDAFGKKLATAVAGAGSLAGLSEAAKTPTQFELLQSFVRIVEPQIHSLVDVAPEPVWLWRGPRRCPTHTAAIAAAETKMASALEIPENDTASPKAVHSFLRGQFKQLRVRRSKTPPHLARLMDTSAARHGMAGLHQAYAAAANCDDCNGWDVDGQARESITMSGLDVALKMCQLHGQVRAHLGHTRLRHHFDNVPCPAIDRRGRYCGARTVGQDDGSEWVDCATCGTQWTETEYDLLVSMIVEDKEIEVLRWLLAEAYWRLDRLQSGLDNLDGNPDVGMAGAGPAILDGLTQIIEGHQRPEQRPTVPALPETAPKPLNTRWSRNYGDPTPYKRPPRKRSRARKPAEHPIAASSLTLLTDIVLGVDS